MEKLTVRVSMRPYCILYYSIPLVFMFHFWYSLGSSVFANIGSLKQSIAAQYTYTVMNTLLYTPAPSRAG